MYNKEFFVFTYDLLYPKQCRTYSNVVYNSDRGLVIGLRNWSGYDAVKIINHVIDQAGPLKSRLLLGRDLFNRIRHPYGQGGIGKYPDQLTASELNQLSILLQSKHSMGIQLDCIFQEISTITQICEFHEITNVGVTMFAIAHYMNWVSGLSENVIAICRMYGKGNTSLDKLSEHLTPLFKKYGKDGEVSKRLYDKITYFMNNGYNLIKK